MCRPGAPTVPGMTEMKWFRSHLCGFDTETTGPDPHRDRIVTVSIVKSRAGGETTVHNWMTDVNGEEIPKEATAVHGVSTEEARRDGLPYRQALAEVVADLNETASLGIPTAAFNAAFDFTILTLEAARLGLPTPVAFPVVDPFVLDKQFDMYRKGSRTLASVCEVYEVTLEDAHSADADATAAIEVARKLGEKYPKLDLPAGQLHLKQMGWRASQALSLQEHLRKKNPDVVIEPSWPVVPITAAA